MATASSIAEAVQLWDWDNPLARYAGETAKANAALQDYIDLGPGRSLRRLHEGYRGDVAPTDPQYPLFRRYYGKAGGEGGTILPPTTSFRTLENWSARYQWQARLARYQQLEADRREAVRQARRERLEDEDWGTGENLRKAAKMFLEELPKFITDSVQEIEQPDGTKVRVITVKVNANLSQLSQAMKVASDLQRLSTNEPTAITELHGATLLGRLVAELDGLAEAAEVPDSESADDPGTAGAPGGDSGPASEHSDE